MYWRIQTFGKGGQNITGKANLHPRGSALKIGFYEMGAGRMTIFIQLLY